MCPTLLAQVTRAEQDSKKGGVIYVMKVETVENLSPWNDLHWVLFLTDCSWASVGTDPPEVCWAIVSGLTGPSLVTWSNLSLFWFWLLIMDSRDISDCYQRGAFAGVTFVISSLSVSPSLLSPLLCLFYLPLHVGIFFFGKFCFVVYFLSFQSLFSVSSGYFIPSGPLEVRVFWEMDSNFWGIQCSICLTNIHFLLYHWHSFRRRNVYPTLPHW